MRNVPKLRFKEFSGDWEEKNILELCSMKARIGWQNLRKEEHLETGEFYLVTGTDFHLERIKWETAKYVDEERYLQDKNIILKEGDVLITKDGSIGKLAFIENIKDRKATLNNGIFRIRIEKEEQYSKYLFYTFLSNRFKLFLQQLTAGSTIVHLYQKDFEKYAIAYPKLKEQEKIADFLSSVDKKISITEEKLDLFKDYKKGVMQKIFKQELRFKDSEGNDYPEWEEKEVGELLVESKILPEKQELEKRITVKLNLKGIEKRKITPEEKEGATTNYLRKEGQFIYGKQNFHKGAFGIIPKELDGYQSSSDIPSFDFIRNLIIGKYFYYYFSQKNVYENLENISTGTGSKRIQPKVFFNVKLDIPCLEEQQKIANFLSSIDDKIDNLIAELENLKEFKKGLLQQMFV